MTTWNIIYKSPFGEYVRIQGQEQCESQKDVSTSDYLLGHCHIVSVNTARLHSSSVSAGSPMELQRCHLADNNNYAHNYSAY